MKQSKKSLLIAAAVAAVVVAALAAGVLFSFFRRARLGYLRQTEYDSVFFSMVPYQDMGADAVGADFFSYYLGIKTVTAPGYFGNFNDLGDHLEAALDSGNEISLVNLELLPFLPGDYDRLAQMVAAYPGTTFQILMNAPSMGYWTSQSKEEAEKQLASYEELTEELLACDNAKVYFVGAEDWMILNDTNYAAPLVASREITKHLALLTMCDQHYRLTADNYSATYKGLAAKIDHARVAPAPVDLSEWCLVFFGDSVIGNYTNTTSIPNAVAALSGCRAYNLGVGGTLACYEGPGLHSFTEILDSFFQRKVPALPEGSVCLRDMAAYFAEVHEGKRLCFVVNYGLNDYFNGVPVENPQDLSDVSTYAGALRSGLRNLKEAFPEAEIILASPNYVDYFDQGQEKQGEAGGTLTDYAEAAGRVAQDSGVIFMDNYHELGIDASNSMSYLADGCHPAENGRFLYAQALIRLIQLRCIEGK